MKQSAWNLWDGPIRIELAERDVDVELPNEARIQSPEGPIFGVDPDDGPALA